MAGAEADSGALRLNYSSPADPTVVDRLERAVAAELAARHPGAQLEDFTLEARAGGEPLGGITGAVFGSTCELLHLFVAPAHRRRGLGTHLLDEAEAEARRRQCRRLIVFTHASQGAARYLRRGYREVGRVEDYPPGDVALWFEKDLQGP